MAEVTLPQLGETVTEGTITQWFKAVGDNVNADEPLFEVSTDKVDTEVPSPVAGTVAEIRVPEGETVSVGTVIAVVNEGGEAPAAAPSAEPAEAPPQGAAPAEAPPAEAPAAEPEPAPAAAEPAPEPAAPAAEPAPAAPEPEPAPAAAEPEPAPTLAAAPAPSAGPAPAAEEAAPAGAAGRLLSPVVRRLVNEHGLDPAKITGTGPGGRITRDDVLDYVDAIASGKAAAAPAALPRRPRPLLLPRRPLRPPPSLLPRRPRLPPPRRRRLRPRLLPRHRRPPSVTRSSS